MTDTSKEIKLAIKERKDLDIKYITPFQGELKLMGMTEKNKLRKQILESGFGFPILVWEDVHEKGKIWIIDGHQRWVVLTELRTEGYTIPKIPCIFIEAGSRKEAKKRVLQAISQYGKLQKHGFIDFIEDDVFLRFLFNV